MELQQINKEVFLNINQNTKYKTQYISLCFLNNITKEIASYSSLLANVLKQGSGKYNSLKEINKKLEDLYGARFSVETLKTGEIHSTYFEFEYLNSNFTLNNEDLEKEILNFINEVIRNPLIINNAFDEKIVEKEKENLINLIKSQIDDKTMLSLNKCTEIMCADESYSLCELGDINTIEKITNSSLYDFYNEFLKTSVIYINYNGSCNNEYLKSELTELSNIKREPNELSTKVIYSEKQVKTITEKLPITQGKLTMGFRTGITAKDENFINLALLNVVFGAGPNSRLFENVREKLSLCYYCSSMVEKNKGIMFVYSGVETNNKEKAVTEILNQLKDLQDGNITDKELQIAKKQLLNTYKSLEDAKKKMSLFNIGQFACKSCKTAKDLINEIDAVTINDIMEASKKVYLDTIFFLAGEEDNSNE